MKSDARDIIESEVGRWNTDIALGWAAGLLGKQRVGHGLYSRRAPEHFYEIRNASRLRDWEDGHCKALQYRASALAREVHYFGWNANGEVRGVRKGWSVKRGQITTQLEKQGCTGDVIFYYTEGGKIVRTGFAR